MNTKLIRSRAPTRIDLAGGTLDIWPIYLLLNHPITINVGIDLCAEVTLEFKPGKGEIELCSEDQKAHMKFRWDELASVSPSPTLILHHRLLHYFSTHISPPHRDPLKDWDLRLSTRATSPAGAGLGGSSTLGIAITGALAEWSRDLSPTHPSLNSEDLIKVMSDIESTVIQVPAGLQDYYGAMYGGLQSIQWQAGRHTRTQLSPEILQDLEKRTLLFYSGQSRNSGINNWMMFKNFIDHQNDVRQKFAKIAQATHDLQKALLAQNWIEVGQAITHEWSIRKTLAPGISTPEIENAFLVANRIHPVSGKICGAGGGGCFFLYLPVQDGAQGEEKKSVIVEALQKLGIQSLPFHFTSKGLEVF